MVLCQDSPLILFTHIPLYRSPGASCGPLREKGTIPAARGIGYQTLLTPETSQLLLNELEPTLIFRYFFSLLPSSHRYFSRGTFPWLTNANTEIAGMTMTTANTPTFSTNDRSPKSPSSRSQSQWGSANQASNFCRSPARRTPMHICRARCPINSTRIVGCTARLYSLQSDS